jgi:hypothetical protein
MDMTEYMKTLPGYARGGKVEKVMHEFKQGTLHSGKGGPVVKDRKQAVAIALSEQRRARGYAEGGEVQGPGTGTSDSVPIAASNGEYVIPAAVVSYLGTAFFDRLVAQTQAEMQRGTAAPGPWDEMAAEEDTGAMIPGGMASAPPRRA